MSSVVVVERRAGEANVLDEARWQAWLAKGRDQERRARLRANHVVRWGSVSALVMGAALGVQLAPYEVVARFAITAGAVAMMLDALRKRQITFAAVFGSVAVLFNPVAPLVSFSGGWERAFAAASVLPFLAPLVSGFGKQARHA